MNGLQDILAKKQSMLEHAPERRAYISTQHQARAWYFITELGIKEDKQKVGMVFRFAKTRPQQCERAWSWLSDYPNARDRFALFLWKMKDLNKNP